MMICDKFVFLHLHKSGGTFINRMMISCIPSARRVGYHLPYSQVPDICRNLPVVGTVRNPWSYYVSWFHFQHAQANPNPLFMICSENKQLDFAHTISNLVNLQSDDSRIDRLMAAFPEQFVSYGLNLTRHCIDKIRGSGLGFYSFLYERLFAGAPSPSIVRMEELRDTFYDLPLGLRGPETMLVRDFIRQAPPMNTSEHMPYADYYSDGLKSLVGDMDRPLIDRHGYEFRR